MPARWSIELFKLGPGPLPLLVAARVALAVGVPLIAATLAGHPVAAVAAGATAMFISLCDIGSTAASRITAMTAGAIAIVGGGALGAMVGGTPHANESIVALSALVTGWVSGSYPVIATIARFFAVAVAASAGMQLHDSLLLPIVVAGAVFAIGVAPLFWTLFDVPPADNLMDWRAGVLRAFSGADAGPWFTVCFAVASALALYAAGWLGVNRPYWATMVVLMVMRREGVASLQLVIHYAAGTLAGIPLAWVVQALLPDPLAVAIAATLSASLVRIGFALNPALGYTAFTLFLVLVIDLALKGAGLPPHLFSERIYDVGVGCAIALVGTLVAGAGHRWRIARAAGRAG